MNRLHALAISLLVLALAAPVRAEPSSSDPADEQQSEPTGRLTKLPELTHFVEAPYPPDAEAEALEGSVLLEIDISAEGRVTRAVVLESAGHGFDESALEAVQRFEFTPAEIDHQPSPVRLTYRYDFVFRPPPASEPTDERTATLVMEGRLLERGTRMPVRDAIVVAKRGDELRETMADGEGRFRFFDLAAGAWTFIAAVPNYERFTTEEEIRDGEVVTATFYVRRRTDGLSAVVRAQREKKEVARRTVTLEEARKIPGTFGDAIRVVQNLPGVARTPLGLGPPIVRGGRPGDTRTYIDGQLVPVLFHFGGFLSVVNSDFMESLDFYPGNAPVRYGRSIAGAVDVHTRSPSRERLRGYANINLTETTLFLETPVLDNGALMASVRRSYIDLVLPTVLDLTGVKGVTVSPVYWDYQLKTEFKFDRDELSVFVFGSDDAVSMMLDNPADVSPEGRGDLFNHTGFHRLATTWKRRLAPGIDNRLVATLGTGSTGVRMGSDVFIELGLDTLALRDDLSFKLSDSVTLLTGIDALAYRYRYAVQGPPMPAPGEIFDPTISDRLLTSSDEGFSFQPALFADVVWKPVESLRIVPGLRVDHDTFIGRTWADPRIAAFWNLTEAFALKASAGIVHQPPTPEKLTKVFGNPELHEEGAREYAAGVEWRVGDWFHIDLQGYYRDLFGVVGQVNELANVSGGLERQVYANSDQARAYGVELLIRRDPGKTFFGWLAVSLGNSERRSGPDEQWVQASLNQRYNIVGVLSWKLPWDFEVGTRLRLTDGNPATPIMTAIYNADADTYIPVPSALRRSIRRPAFFQADLRIDRRFVFRTWTLDAYVDIMNVTNHRNVEGETSSYDFAVSRPVHGLPIFPSFGIRGEF